MRMIKPYLYNKKILTFSEMMLFAVSVLLGIYMFILLEPKAGLLETVQNNLTFNIIYLLCMFDAICFLEMMYYGRKIKKREQFHHCVTGILLLAVAQLFLLNFPAAIVLLFFVFQTLRKNKIALHQLVLNDEQRKARLMSILNILFYVMTIGMLYTMIIHQF